MKTRCLAVLTAAICFLPACGKKSDPGLTVAGVVDGEVITVRSQVPGRLTELNFDEGETVERGAVLIRLDSEKLRNRMDGLELGIREIALNRRKLDSRRELLQTTFDYWLEQVARLERLLQSESVSGDELEKARLKSGEAKAGLDEVRQSLRGLDVQHESILVQLEGLRLQLADMEIAAPVSGFVLERYVSPGEILLPGSPVADLLDPLSLYVEVYVEEQELSSLRIGQRVEIQTDGRPQPLSGTIIRFNRRAEFSPKYIISEKERRSLLYGVRVRADEGQEILKVGMPVTVRMR